MPPIRRYLRITQYSVLECRIYLDNPADAQRWLLNPRAPVLPRVIEAVRPLVLPKLREENARAKSGKGGKKKGWKDVVVEEDFEVAVFLTETSSRHALLKKDKRAKSEKSSWGITKGRLTGAGTQDVPVDVEGGTDMPMVREESQENPDTALGDIPLARNSPINGDAHAAHAAPQGGRDSLFVSEGSEDEQFQAQGDPLPTNEKRESVPIGQGDRKDDKKKLALNTTYDGFTIYGRILCLVIKRRGSARGREQAGVSGQAMMEEWIASTQAGEGQMMDD